MSELSVFEKGILKGLFIEFIQRDSEGEGRWTPRENVWRYVRQQWGENISDNSLIDCAESLKDEGRIRTRISYGVVEYHLRSEWWVGERKK